VGAGKYDDGRARFATPACWSHGVDDPLRRPVLETPGPDPGTSCWRSNAATTWRSDHSSSACGSIGSVPPSCATWPPSTPAA